MKPEDESWFSQLAEYVCNGLNDCGYIYCPGNIMATNNNLRQPLKEWMKTVDRWMRTPTERAVMEVSIFFDLRTIYGDNELAKKLQTHMLNDTKSIF